MGSREGVEEFAAWEDFSMFHVKHPQLGKKFPCKDVSRETSDGGKICRITKRQKIEFYSMKLQIFLQALRSRFMEWNLSRQELSSILSFSSHPVHAFVGGLRLAL